MDQETLERVFAATAAVEARGADVRVEQIVDEAGLSGEDVRAALSELSHRSLVAEFVDDGGRRYTVKDRG